MTPQAGHDAAPVLATAKPQALEPPPGVLNAGAMNSKYRVTSEGGLAVAAVLC